MDRLLRLDPGRIAEMLAIPESHVVDVRPVHTRNHVWRVITGDSVYFVKAHTKDWYDHAPASGRPVRNELSGHRILRAAGLPAAEVIAYELSRDNPLRWPYLIMRELAGRPLIELLAGRNAEEAVGSLAAVGRYLATMHSLTYEHPGPLIDGPPGPPDPDQWLHWLSRLERFLLYFFENLITDDDISLSTKDAAAGLLARVLPQLRDSYVPLRFVHGDCHANTFFLIFDDGWHVSGLVDMENCSAGNPLFDFAKFMIEMAGRFGACGQWWEPLFDGYGSEPDIDLLRTIMIGHAHINFTWLGPHAWAGGREAILRRLLAARSWQQLFDQQTC